MSLLGFLNNFVGAKLEAPLWESNAIERPFSIVCAKEEKQSDIKLTKNETSNYANLNLRRKLAGNPQLVLIGVVTMTDAVVNDHFVQFVHSETV